MGVGETRAVKDVFKPGPAWNSVGIEPVALDLQHAFIDFLRESGIEFPRGQRSVATDRLRFLPAASNFRSLPQLV